MSDAETTHEPDWVIAPSEHLKDWLEEAGMTPDLLAAASADPSYKLTALGYIHDVLDRRPLTLTHAEMLSQGTGVKAGMWMAFEANYREGLAAGKQDISDE